MAVEPTIAELINTLTQGRKPSVVFWCCPHCRDSFVRWSDDWSDAVCLSCGMTRLNNDCHCKECQERRQLLVDAVAQMQPATTLTG